MPTANPSTPDPQPPTPVPPFVPHPLLWNGHLQTIAGRYLPGPKVSLPFEPHEIEVEGDGDRVVVFDSTPEGWRPDDPAALLVHGLAGDATSPYVVRLGARLRGQGVRVVRMNLRGAGAGFGLARGTYHAGRTDDLRRVVRWLSDRAPGSPVALVGFSLGANLVLKLAAEAAETPLPGLDCVLAANPPIDLAAACRRMQNPGNRIYDRNFVRQLRLDTARLHAAFPDLAAVNLPKVMTLYDFDHLYTAPRNGFNGAEDYYARNSAGPLIPRIQVPGLVVHAADDPFIPAESFRSVSFPPRLALELISSGGHLGYLSRRAWGGSHRWLDGRFSAWLAEHWLNRRTRPAGPVS